MNDSTLQPEVFTATPEAECAALDQLLTKLSGARDALTPAEFRAELRTLLLDRPDLTLAKIAQALGVTRQRVSLLVGRLDRPTCAHPDRPAPKQAHAARKMAALVAKVRAGESAEQAASDLGVSLTAAAKMGFRVKKFRPPHGTRLRAVGDEGMPGCDCWRCRKVKGIALPRGPRTGPARKAAVLDWHAWSDPDTGERLRQAEIGRLAGVGQPIVSRIVRAAGER